MAALRWQSATRYYQVKVQRDLFGGLVLLCSWGGLRSRRCQHKLIPCENLAMLRRAVRRIGKLRRRHGYRFLAHSADAVFDRALLSVQNVRKTEVIQVSLPLFPD